MKITQLMIVFLVAASCLFPAKAVEIISGKELNRISEAMSQQAQAAVDSIVAPNVFTPNRDGLNDLFEVTSSGSNPVSLRVFTRAGVLVFSIEAKICQWDGYSQAGQEMVNGVYYYTAEIAGSSPKVAKSGFVHLYR